MKMMTNNKNLKKLVKEDNERNLHLLQIRTQQVEIIITKIRSKIKTKIMMTMIMLKTTAIQISSTSLLNTLLERSAFFDF